MSASHITVSSACSDPRSGDTGHQGVHRGLTAYVTGGIDGVMRVGMMMRGRGCRVRDFSADIREGAVESTVRVTALVTPEEGTLLLDRLRRLPSVVAADFD